MRKQLISSFVGLLLVGMGSQAFAQQQGWQGGIALPSANEALRQWTNQPLWGVCLDGAYALPIADSRSSFRVGLGINVFPGKEGNFNVVSTAPRTISLTGIQLAGDIVVPLGNSSFSAVTGFSLNTWIKDVSGKLGYPWGEKLSDGTIVIHPAGTMDNNVSGTVDNVFGKYGLRLGLEYTLNDKVTLSALFQMTELGTDSEFMDLDKYGTTYAANGTSSSLTSGVVTYGKKRVLPSWIQFGVRYNF
ncbi:MAG: hypothetical protein FWG12_03685 [Holophagaceae bacterium]|jgi:hypothetical protein|nr:hypothetical protein [Holophagaceae bacterium]